MRRVRRIKGLNRRVFYSNLKRVLKPEYAKDLKWFFEDWVNDYQDYIDVTSNYGWYEIKAFEHIKGYTEQIRTC